MAAAERVERGYLGSLLRLRLLAPNLVEAILDGRQATTNLETPLPELTEPHQGGGRFGSVPPAVSWRADGRWRPARRHPSAGSAQTPDASPPATCLGMHLGAKDSGVCATEPSWTRLEVET